MAENSRRTVIIEFNRFHDEVIFPQLQILKANGVNYLVLINECLLNNGLLPDTDKNIIAIRQRNKICKFINVLIALLKTRKEDNIILNSADWMLSVLFLVLSSNRRIVGIVHNADRLFQKKYRVLQKKCRKIVVLNEQISLSLSERGINADTFYPLLAPSDFPESFFRREKPAYLTVSIPGVIAFDKRDYLSVVDCIVRHKDKLKDSLKIEILGNIQSTDGKELLLSIREKGIEEIFILYHEFIPYPEFIKKIALADFLLPLEKTAKYGSMKISAVYNFSMGFDVPCLMDESQVNIPGIYCRKAYYTTLDEALVSISSGREINIIDDRKAMDKNVEYMKIISDEV